MLKSNRRRWIGDSVLRGNGRTERRPRLLLVCDFRPREAAAVLDHIEAIRAWSRYDVFVLPIFGDLPDELDLDVFDGLLIHYNIVMSNSAYLSPLARWRIRQYRGVKGAFIQDEYRFVNRSVSVMRTLGISVLFTNVPQDQVALMYPREALPAMERTVTVLTGYVPEALLAERPRPYHHRAVDVAYRGRRLPAWLGRLAQEKSAIADRFAADAPNYGLVTDISCEEEDRLYGGAWTDFLSRSKAILGVETGASIIDFDGSVEDAVRGSLAVQPDISFDQLHRLHLTEIEGRIRLNQISPRCFEAAALGTLMVLYPGHYSGVLQPWRHYVPLRKDHSNMDEVVRAIRDQDTWERITSQAREEVAANSRFAFRAMVQAVDDGLDLQVDDRRPIQAAGFERISSRSFARMPFTQLYALGLPTFVNRAHLRVRAVARLLKPSRLVMSVSSVPPETGKMRFRQFVALVRTLTYWAARPRSLPWSSLLAGRSALLKDLTVLGRVQDFGARATASGGGSPFLMLVSRPANEIRVVLRSDAAPSGMHEFRLPDDLSWGPAIALSLEYADPWLIPAGLDDPPERTLKALSAVVETHPEVARRLLDGPSRWCDIVLADPKPDREMAGSPAAEAS